MKLPGRLTGLEFLASLSNKFRRTRHFPFQSLQIAECPLNLFLVPLVRIIELERLLPSEIHLHLPLFVREDSSADRPGRRSRCVMDGQVFTGFRKTHPGLKVTLRQT